MSTDGGNKSFAERTLSLVRTDLFNQHRVVMEGLDSVNPRRLQLNEPTSDSFWSSLELRDQLIARRVQLELALRGIESDSFWVARDFYQAEIANLQASLPDCLGEDEAKRKGRIAQMKLYVARLA